MPGLNQTGPNGAGPMTGRGVGKCTGNQMDFSSQGMGRGMRKRSFRGRGMGFKPNGFSAGNEEILTRLKQQKKRLEEEIQRRESGISN